MSVVVMLYKDKIPPSIIKRLEAAGIIPVRTSYLADVSFRIVEVPPSNSSRVATPFIGGKLG